LEKQRPKATNSLSVVAMVRIGYEREYTEQLTRDRLDAILRERLPAAERERLTAEGAALAPQMRTRSRSQSSVRRA
jgi:hypothetical protein